MYQSKPGLALLRSLCIVILAGAVISCGDGIQEYQLDSATIDRFAAQAATLAQRDDEYAPLATPVLATNQIGAPQGVKIWNPDATLQSVGIKNGDLIALVDDEVPLFGYSSAFAANQVPFASATEQYVHFVQWLLDKQETQQSVLLSVHLQYRTSAERKEHGGIHAKEPALLRIVFP